MNMTLKPNFEFQQRLKNIDMVCTLLCGNKTFREARLGREIMEAPDF